MTTDSATDDPVLARRRRVVVIAICVLLVLVLAVIIGSLVRTTDPQPSPGEGLLPWPPRGPLVDDQTLIDTAESLWRAGTDSEGRPVASPGDEIYVLWADRIGAGRLVVLEAIGTDGNPYVAQASEQGDPAVLRLDAVEALPSADLVALAVTYDGNLHIDGLEPGRGSALIQLLPEPPDASDTTGLWRYESLFASAGLQRLETKPSGMTETFLQVDVSDPDGTPVVVTTTIGASAGVAATLAVHGRRLIPETARIALADDPDWGPSGRIIGQEYTALSLAATHLEISNVSGFVAASEEVDVFGSAAVVSLVVLEQPQRPTRVACVLTDAGVEDTIADAVHAEPGAVDLVQQRVLAAWCPVTVGPHPTAAAVAVAAGRPDVGEVVLEAGGQVVAGPAESLAIVLDEQPAGARPVARLDGDDGQGSSFELGPLPD